MTTTREQWMGSFADVTRDVTVWIAPSREVMVEWTGQNVESWGRPSSNPVFVRCASLGSQLAVVLVDGSRDVAMLRVSGQAWIDLCPTFGQTPVEVANPSLPHHFLVWVQTGPELLIEYAVGPAGLVLDSLSIGIQRTSQGILDSAGSIYMLTDAWEWRQGLRYATHAGLLLVGQADTRQGGHDALEADWGGQRLLLHPGLVFEPRVALDSDQTYRIVGRMPDGTVLEIRGTPPFDSPTVPPVTEPPTPEPGPEPEPEPEPEPDPMPLPPYPDEHALAAEFAQDYAEAGRPTQDVLAGVWQSRTVYDHCAGMTLEQATYKHRQELRAELGLPPLPPL